MSEIYANLGNICGICVREPPQSHLRGTLGHEGGWWGGVGGMVGRGETGRGGETGGGGEGDGGGARPSTETAGKCVRSKQINET